MLPIQLGNYLKKSDLASSQYRWFKPVILAGSFSLLIAAVTVFLLAVCTYVYALLFKPTQICSPDILASAKAMNDRVNQKIAFNDRLRPNNISVCRVIDHFVGRMVTGVTLNGISIKPEEYVIRGYGASMDKIHLYVEALNFGKDWHSNLDVLENRDGVIFWTINVKYAGKKK